MSMSIRQFAKELGISDGAVRKAIKTGRIPPDALGIITVGTRTIPTIEDVRLAAKCYRAGTRHNKGHQAGSKATVHPEITKARFAREMFGAKREELAYEREAGLLVPRSKIVVAIHAAGKALREIVPSRHRPALDKILQALKDAIDRQDEDRSS